MMKKERKLKKMIIWAILSALAVSVFWLNWRLITGFVPVVDKIKICKGLSYGLPFAISRWWDILFAPAWAMVILWLVGRKWEEDWDNKIIIAGILSLAAVFGFCLSAAVSYPLDIRGFDFAMVFVMAMYFVLMLVIAVLCFLVNFFAPPFNLKIGFGFGLGFGLTFGLIFGLIFGLGIGLIFGACFDLFLILGFYFGATMKHLANFIASKKMYIPRL